MDSGQADEFQRTLKELDGLKEEAARLKDALDEAQTEELTPSRFTERRNGGSMDRRQQERRQSDRRHGDRRRPA
jgi:hypothetical protein